MYLSSQLTLNHLHRLRPPAGPDARRRKEEEEEEERDSRLGHNSQSTHPFPLHKMIQYIPRHVGRSIE
jgi:hypothetical protein